MKSLLMLKQVLYLDTITKFVFIILLLEHNNIICFLAMLKTKGFIELKGSKRDFEGADGGRRLKPKVL